MNEKATVVRVRRIASKKSVLGKSARVHRKMAKEKSSFARWTESAAISCTRFSVKEQTHFAKRLAFLVDAGVPLIEALYMLRSQTKSRAKGLIFERITADVSEGQYLSASLGRFSRFFGDFAVNLIKIGETAGVLSQNLNYLADELKKKYELRKKVIGALIYPIFISIATILLVGLLIVFIFPKVMPIFQSLSVELPFTTRALLWISSFLRDFGLWLLGGIVVFVFLFWLAHRHIAPFRVAVDYLVLKMPLTGRISKYYHTTNFCRTLGLLLKSSVGVVEAASITGDTMSNEIYKRHCKKISQRVARGERMATHLQENQAVFPDIAGHMVAVGEASGSLSDTLIYLSELYESEVDDLTKNLSNSIEPALMIFLGTLVGFVAVSVITPIYEITQTISNQM